LSSPEGPMHSVSEILCRITLAFQTDYTEWNDTTFRCSERSDCFGIGEVEYDALIVKYCGHDKQHLLLAYGSESRHDPERERIERIEILGNRATVYVGRYDDGEFNWACQYRYKEVQGRWILDELYYVDEWADGELLPLL
jgi:hypothetical protein